MRQVEGLLLWTAWTLAIAVTMGKSLCRENAATVLSQPRTERNNPWLSVPFHHLPSGWAKPTNIWRVPRWCTLKNKLSRAQSRQAGRQGSVGSEGEMRKCAVWWCETLGRHFLLIYVFVVKYTALKIKQIEVWWARSHHILIEWDRRSQSTGKRMAILQFSQRFY